MHRFKVLTFTTILVVGLVINAQAQVCGPGCPICSGSGSSTGAILPSGTVVSTAMAISENWSPFLNYDGRNFHFGLSWIPLDWLFIAGLMIEAKTPAILVGYRWSF